MSRRVISVLSFSVLLEAALSLAQSSPLLSAPTRIADLRACSRMVERNEAGSEEFLRKVNKWVESFPEVKPCYVTGEMEFTQVMLNQGGAGFDAIRFRTKTGYNWQMIWCYAAPVPSRPEDPEWGNLRNWYIIRRNGEMKGFTHQGNSFSGAGYQDAPWDDRQMLTIQELSAAPLLPNEEYLIWFCYEDERPVEQFLQICLVPWDSWRRPTSVQSVFGLKKNPPPIPEDPDEQLMHWVTHANMEGVVSAVNRGADVNVARDKNGMSALSWAVLGVNEELVKYLLEQGADVREKDAEGYTPLHQAARVRRTEHAILLIERGADVNAKNSTGLIPLQLALDGYDLDFVKTLVSEGSDLSVTNQYGQTPVEEARAQRHHELAAYLEAQSKIFDASIAPSNHAPQGYADED